MDITEQKQTEEQLRKSELLADVILGSLHDEIVTLDQTGVIVTANDAWFKAARRMELTSQQFRRGKLP